MSYLMEVDRVLGGYGDHTVIKDVSFKISEGEFLGIIGPNGSGKSTLLKLMTRVLYPDKGNILFDEQDISVMNLKPFCRKIGFVPQDTVINFSFSVWEIVLMGRIPHLKRLQMETQNDFFIAEKSLILTDSLPLKEKKIDQLSAGERQRVIISRALTQEPVLLFLDEPTSHLDITHQTRILDLLQKLNREKGLTIVIVLHDLNLASEYCSRLILLNEGSIFKDGLPKDVLTYNNIEEVYKTVVVVNENPVSSKPHVMLVSQQEKWRQHSIL